ncbi:class II glutamine amidotransferase domain-containing protein [Methanobrevibacter sp.]
MCGIAGIVYKDGNLHNVGDDMTNMLNALQHRGPDSAGFALYGGLGLEEDEYILNIQLENTDKNLLRKVQDQINMISPIESDRLMSTTENANLYQCKLKLEDFHMLKPLIQQVDNIDDSVVVINGEHSFSMIKDVGSVLDIADNYNTRSIKGTHAIGHTRFSTESGVDLYHAHPFQTYIIRDISLVHNGQITNYWKVRDPLERKGHVFETNNDTECLVHYIADKIDSGYSLEEALEHSVEDMDGPFSYIVSTPNGIGIAKDKLGLRPGVMAETDEIFAIASEEVSLGKVIDTSEVEQIYPGEVRVFEI